MEEIRTNSLLMSVAMLMTVAMVNGCVSTQTGGHKADSRQSQDIERLSFEQASKENSAVAYENFLVDHPNGELAVHARSKLAAIETRDWEDACKSDTLDVYIRFHKAHRKASCDELRHRLLKLAGDSAPVAGGDLTEHISYIKKDNRVEFHNLNILYGESSDRVSASASPGTMVGLLGAPG